MAAIVACLCRSADAADVPAPPQAALASLSLVTEPNGLVDVPVQIAGHPLKLRLDTGEMMGMVTETSATTLALPRDHVPYHDWLVFAGARLTEFAIVDSIRFDHFDATGAKFPIVADGSLPFDIAGKLGADVLRNYDVELDMSRGKLNIYSPGQCAHIWPAGAGAELAMDVTGKGRAIVNVELDGKPVRALLNTGFHDSFLSGSASKDMFGITEKTAGVKVLASPNGVASRMSYPFKTLALESATVADPDIVIQTTLPQRPDLIIGENIIRQLHVCIGYDAEKLYVALPSAH